MWENGNLFRDYELLGVMTKGGGAFEKGVLRFMVQLVDGCGKQHAINWGLS